MANPVLNDATLRQAVAADRSDRSGWAAPQAGSQFNPPINDGPVTRQPGVMTMDGTITATGALLALILVMGGVGWVATKPAVILAGQSRFSGVGLTSLVAMLASFGLGILMRFKPKLSPIVAPLYALAMGFALGSISRRYETLQHGIVLQAIGATVAVFVVMLALYKTRIIKVTDKMRRVVGMATGGLMLFYLVSIVLNLVGVQVPFIHSASPIGILFSVFAAGLAAWNLALDFDTTERGVAAGAPKYMEWYCAFGITSTLVWLYLELLRLMSKLNRR
jgi:uncharacterized YccA/Bax inhibitor family protein